MLIGFTLNQESLLSAQSIIFHLARISRFVFPLNILPCSSDGNTSGTTSTGRTSSVSGQPQYFCLVSNITQSSFSQRPYWSTCAEFLTTPRVTLSSKSIYYLQTYMDIIAKLISQSQSHCLQLLIYDVDNFILPFDLEQHHQSIQQANWQIAFAGYLGVLDNY